MSAAPHAYDDLAAAYAEEISPVHHGLLRVMRRCGDTLVQDRRTHFHPVDQDGGGPAYSPFLEEVSHEFEHPERVRPAFVRSTPEDITRAAHNGGAANKARWAKITAAKKALKEAA